MIYKKRVVIINDDDLSSNLNGAAYDEQRIYYRSKRSITNWTENDLPENWITNENNIWNESKQFDGPNGWTTKVTPITKVGTGAQLPEGTEIDKYLFLYTCLQRKSVGGDIFYSPVLLDESTTVIDGGTIVTNSVYASSLNAQDINASGTFTIGSLAQETQDAILNDNIQIGGRNLLLSTVDLTNVLGEESTYSDGIITVTRTNSTNWYAQALSSPRNPNLNLIQDCDYLTLSVDIKKESNFSASSMSIEIDLCKSSVTSAADRTRARGQTTLNLWSDTDWHRYILTVPTNYESWTNQYSMNLSDADCFTARVWTQNQNGTYKIRNPKLEIGNKATDWTPAPEDVNSAFYCICQTDKDVANKIVACDNFILNTGAIITVNFTKGNSCQTAMTLNVAETGAKNVVMAGNNNAGSSEPYHFNLQAGATATFAYNGTSWVIIGDNQLRAQVIHMNDGGILIHPFDSTNQRIQINSDGVETYYDSTHYSKLGSNGLEIYAGNATYPVASYGNSIKIGAIMANTYRTEVTSGGFTILQRNSSNTADTEISSFNSSGISFNANIPLTVGTTNSYIKWIKENNVWKIKIQADEITMGGHSIDTGGTWYTGITITGTSTADTTFSNSEISYALVGDMYLNTSTNNTYRCTVEGNASTAKWAYVGNLKGANGTSYYVHIRYSANSDGTDFTTSPQSNTQYIGIYSGTSSTAPTTKTSYTWSKYKGDKGDDTSSQYMTFTAANGLRVYSGDKTNNTYNTSYTQIKTDGITLVKGGYTAATFGSSITLNKPGTNTAVITIDSNGNATVNNIIASSGTIGGFDINESNIHHGKTSRTETTNDGIWIGTDGIGLGRGITYFSTDGTGKIGPWTLSTAYIRNGNIVNATNTTVAGVYLGTDGLNISNGTAATTAYITKSAVNIGGKLIWNSSSLSVEGEIKATSGIIGNSAENKITIGTNTTYASLYSGSHSTLASTVDGFYLGTNGLSIGANFNTTNEGILTATGVILNTAILQNSLQVGDFKWSVEQTGRLTLWYEP